MKSTLLELVTSKKFLAAITAIVVYVAGRFGLALDPAALDHIFAALLVYVGAQGVADAGKSAAQIKAVTATAGMTPESSDALKRIASATAVIGIVIVAVLLQAGCATAERGGHAAKVAALKCGEPQLATAAAIVARWAVEDALAGKVQWDKHETDALGFGLGVGTCAYAEVVRAWKAKPTPQALALSAGPDEFELAQAGLERLRTKAGGAQIVLADGTVI